MPLVSRVTTSHNSETAQGSQGSLEAASVTGRSDSNVTAQTTHQLYQQYGRQIYAYCLHQLRSREEAEDAVQTTFLNAFRGLQGGTVTHAEQAWLYKIAQNVCFARRSSSSRRLRLETPNNFETLQEIVPSPQQDGAVELIGLEDALEAMPENQRRAILLREWQGLSYREIAEELGLTQASVEMLIFRARRALASALEQPDGKRAKRKAGQSMSIGSLLAALKSFLTGGAAVKAVALAVAGTLTVVAKEADHTIVHHSAKRTRPVAAVTVPAQAAAFAPARSSAGASGTALEGLLRRAVRHAGPHDGGTPATSQPAPDVSVPSLVAAAAPATTVTVPDSTVQPAAAPAPAPPPAASAPGGTQASAAPAPTSTTSSSAATPPAAAKTSTGTDSATTTSAAATAKAPTKPVESTKAPAAASPARTTGQNGGTDHGQAHDNQSQNAPVTTTVAVPAPATQGGGDAGPKDHGHGGPVTGAPTASALLATTPATTTPTPPAAVPPPIVPPATRSPAATIAAVTTPAVTVATPTTPAAPPPPPAPAPAAPAVTVPSVPSPPADLRHGNGQGRGRKP